MKKCLRGGVKNIQRGGPSFLGGYSVLEGVIILFFKFRGVRLLLRPSPVNLRDRLPSGCVCQLP